MPQFRMQFMKWEKIKGKSRKWMENGREMPSILGGKGEREKKTLMKLESSLDQVPSPLLSSQRRQQVRTLWKGPRLLRWLRTTQYLSMFRNAAYSVQKKKIYISKSWSMPALLPGSISLTAECLISTYRLHREESTGPPHGERRVLGTEMVAMEATWCSPGTGERPVFHLFAGQGCRP